MEALDGEKVAKDLKAGEWYEVEILTLQTKKLSGMFTKRYRSSEGDLLHFEGRYPFTVEVERIVAAEPTEPPRRTVSRSQRV